MCCFFVGFLCPLAQLIVPGVEDDLVNFHVDTAAVRNSFGRLRRSVQIRQQVIDHQRDEEQEEMKQGCVRVNNGS